MADSPSVNRVTYDFSSIEFRADDVWYPELQEINYSQELSRQLVYGTPVQPIGRTRGQLKPEANIVLLRNAFNRMVDQFGDGFYEKEFEIVVLYNFDGEPLVTDTLQKCTIMKPEAGGSQGGDPLTIKVDLSLLGILYNGKKPTSGYLPL